MTVVLLGLAVVALVSTMLAVIVTANSHRRRVQASNELISIAERIERFDYVPCATTSTYASAMDGVGSDNFTPTVQSVEWLVDRTAATATFRTTGCTGGNDQGTQRITLRISSPKQNQVTETLVVLKRDDRCTGLTVSPGTKC